MEPNTLIPTRIFDILEVISAQYEKPDFFARRDGEGWKTYSIQDYVNYSHVIASALLELGFEKGDKIVTIMRNRPAWNFLDMGIMLAGMIHVPVYPTLNPDEYKYILNHCDCKCIVFGQDAIYKRVAGILPEVEQHPVIYAIDPIEGITPSSELVEIGKKNFEKWRSVIEDNKKNIQPDDVATIIYTSGTTGRSKGVMLTHKNICSNFLPLALEFQLLDYHAKMLSFLPLCHVYERIVNYHYQFMGVSHYYAGSLATIGKDMHDMKADGFCAVPRVFEMMYDKIQAAGKNLKGIKKWIFDWAFRIATVYDYDNNNPLYKLKYEIADKLVYSKWRENLSGKEMTVVSGGSSISGKIIRLFTAAKVRVYEGYGLTETSPVIAVNNPRAHIIKVGCVGVILPGVECKIADDGEILTKGPCLMKGYYKDEAYTREVIDEDGWFHTGDIGTFVEGRYLKITDRKKEVFKLSLGKFVSPQVVETKLRESSYIDNVMVIGENEKFASAIIVPSFEKMNDEFKKRHIAIPKTREEYIIHPHFVDIINKEVADVNKTLADHEQIKRYRLITDEWSTESGELSQTLKLKRKVIYQKYDALCREIYNYDKKDTIE
ncbi:MAG: long-chain fatty acid--CoA ligase [Bacteroidales bacterium]|nr:long-chain fatty acid--CoA ligase [Bacteroidales bacterium]